MVEQRMVSLKERLAVLSNDIDVFYVFYRYLNLLFSGSEGLRSHAMKGVVIRKADVAYSLYLDFFLFFFKRKVSDVNLNCSYRRFPYFKKRGGLQYLWGVIVGRDVDLHRYMRGLAGRGKVYRILIAHGCDGVDELWRKIVEDQELRDSVAKISRKVDLLFNRLMVERLFAIDFSDSLNLLALSLAKKNSVKVIVIPHGYIQNFSELYSYAHLSDAYICWSRSEAEAISDLMAGRVATIYAGCPAYTRQYVDWFSKSWLERSLRRNRKKVVFFCNPLSGADNEAQCKEFIVGLSNFLQEKGVVFQVKLHQRDVLDEIGEYFRVRGVEVIDGPVEHVLLDTDLALGFQTTVLYQASTLNVSSLQLILDGGSCFKFDLVKQLRISGSFDCGEILKWVEKERVLKTGGLDIDLLRRYLERL